MRGGRFGLLVVGAVLVGVLAPVAVASPPVPAVPPTAAAGPVVAQGGAKPNFVLLVTDDQRYDSIGRCSPTFDGSDYGSGANSCMPQLAQKLINSGVTFVKGEVTQSLCCPSRASILSGLYTTHHGVTNLDGASFDDSATLATWLDAAGYRNGLVGKYLNGYGAGALANYIPPGWDAFHSFHGYTNQDNPYTNYPWIDWVKGGPMVVTRHNDVDSTSTAACADGNLYSTDLICNISQDFLAADTASPFFLYLNPASPHNPQTIATRHQGLYTGLTIPTYPSHNAIPQPNPPAFLPSQPLSTSAMNRNLNSFRQALEQNRAVDDMIGAIHDQLSADGRLANTVWIFISDNGGGTGEHRLTGKQCPYTECHRVPFVVVCPTGICPGAGAGVRDTTNHALNIDIAPTIVQLAGATATLHMDGRSLVPILSNPNAPFRTTWAQYDLDPPIEGIVAKQSSGDWFRYLEDRESDEVQLFNLTDDPWELTNLWNELNHTAIQADMAARLVDSKDNPTLTITSQPPASSSGTSATMTYSSDESVTFECALNSNPATACGTGMSGSITYTGLASTSHTVKIQAVDGYGNLSPVRTVTFALTGGPGDTQPPSAPTGLATTTLVYNSVALSWGPSTDDTGVAHYAVARNGSDIGTSTTTSFVDNSVQPGTNYTYQVFAVDAAGNRSPGSNQLPVRTPAPPPNPPAITGFPDDPSGPTVTFAFDALGDITFDCTLDGVTAACASPTTYSGLAAGAHTFSVASKNADGVLSAPAVFTWTSKVYLCSGKVATIWGTDGDDSITGTSGADVIVGLGGNDVIGGLGGDDVICGGPGDDTLDGNHGNNTLLGGAGDDTLLTGNGDDTLVGGDGADFLSGGSGTDTLLGGNGIDLLLAGPGNDTLVGGAGSDTLTGGPGADILEGGGGDDTITGNDGKDVLTGGGGKDVLTGGNGNDTLDGNGGDDILNGSGGDDALTGGAGSDKLNGNAGDDKLVGGAGNDALNGGPDSDTCQGGAGTDTGSACELKTGIP